MNANDVKAARRLIAQFEDKAVGRHNSAHLPSRQTMLPSHADLPTVTFRAAVDTAIRGFSNFTAQVRDLEVLFYSDSLKSSIEAHHRFRKFAEDCRVGECVWDLPGALDNMTLFRFPVLGKPIVFSDEISVPAPMAVLDFEAIHVRNHRGRSVRRFWRRIA